MITFNIPTIIDIIIFRQAGRKSFNFIIKYMVHDKKLFLFFNLNFYWIYFLYIFIGLSPQLLMTYLYRHSSDERDILIDFMPFLWDSICNDTKATVEYKSFSSQGINDILFFNIFKNYENFSNNTNFVGIRFGISMSCFDMKAIFSSFFGFMIDAFFNESTDIYDILHYPSLPLLSIL